MMRVRHPDDALAVWRVDVTLSRHLLPDFMNFCYDSFGDPDSASGWDDQPARWMLQYRDRLRPPWLELYFRRKSDVALLKLFDVTTDIWEEL